MHEFVSKARSSELAPRYDLIEPELLLRLANRMAQGAASHGVRNYVAGALDDEFLLDRINHLLGHAIALASGRDDEDHLAAVAANCNIIARLQQERRGYNRSGPTQR